MRTIGIIGGGQLARMLAIAAARLNFRTIILEPQPDCCAAALANQQIIGAYGDEDALDELARQCDIVTYEFENVPIAAARYLAEKISVYPPPRALEISQDRLLEKQFLNANGLKTADFRKIDSVSELNEALVEFGGRGVLKTRRLGYDGKGQIVFSPGGPSPGQAYRQLAGVPLVLESLVAFEREISVIAARSPSGDIAAYDPAENIHKDGILHSSTLPARISASTAQAAKEASRTLLEGLDYVGVIGIEFFVNSDGTLVTNEMAPRVHNSGHWTEAACVISQFEQHIRAICGLPLGNPERHSNCVMQNLIGEDIETVTDWMAKKNTLVHLYGKSEARPGRKMGHVTQLTGRFSMQ